MGFGMVDGGLNNFNFSLYRLILEAEERIELTRINKGITLRGAFGTVFRSLVCHDRKADCKECTLHPSCPYSCVFSPVVPSDAKRLRLNRDIPRPFVIKPPLNGQDCYQKGDTLCFDLVVVGKARDYLPYFIVTFEELGRRGVGVKRGRYRLKKLEAMNGDCSWQEIYDYRERMVKPPSDSIRAADVLTGDDSSINFLEVEFLTPILLKEGGKYVRPEFGPLMKRLRDRISALSYFYCGNALDIDFHELGEMADAVNTSRARIEWIEENRYSKNRNLRHILKGFIGNVSYEGNLGPFMPFLRLGEYLHVGKATAFGQGWYKLRISA